MAKYKRNADNDDQVVADDADNDENANNDNQEVADNDENADNGIQEVAGERSNPIQANALGIFNTTATSLSSLLFG